MGEDDPSLNAPGPPIGAPGPSSATVLVVEAPPPGFRYACPECGKWKTNKGKPYTQGGLNFHRLNAHGHRRAVIPKEDMRPETAQEASTIGVPANTGPIPAGRTSVARASPAPVQIQQRDEMQLQDDDPNMRDAAEELNYESFVTRERKRNLIKALNANNLMAKVSKQYILNNWSINSTMQEDPTQFYDFLMRIPEMLKHNDWARDIVDITFTEAEPSPPPSPYYAPRRNGRGMAPQSPYYGAPAPRAPYGYQPQQGYGRAPPDPYGQDPRDMGYKSPWEVEEEKRKERENWERDRRADELERRNAEMAQALSNPPPPPVNPADIIQKTVEALVQKLQPAQANPETTAMREELRTMREDQARMRAEGERAKTEIAVQNNVAPLVREVQELRAQQAARDAAEQTRRQTIARYEQMNSGKSQGLSDDATVALEEVKSQTTQFTAMAGNLNKTMNNFINAVTRIITPGAPNVNTAGMTEAEKAELERVAKQG